MRIKFFLKWALFAVINLFAILVYTRYLNHAPIGVQIFLGIAVGNLAWTVVRIVETLIDAGE